jgi:hypothetical protein
LNHHNLNEWLSTERTELKNSIKTAIKNHIKILTSENPDLYGYALLPGEPYEVESLVVAWNRLSDIKEDTIYYRYSVDEWEIFDHTSLESVTPIIAELNQKFLSMHATDPDEFELDEFQIAHIAAYNYVFITALKELKSEGVFHFGNTDLFVVIWYSDSAEELIFESVKELNSSEVFNSFMQEFGEQEM